MKTRSIQTEQGDTVDRIAYRYYGEAEGAFEAILSANRHLSAQGTILPLGLTIRLPELAEPDAPLLALWPEPSA